jgi:hypothetical protein
MSLVDDAGGAGAGTRGVGSAWQARELQGKGVGVRAPLEDMPREARPAWGGTRTLRAAGRTRQRARTHARPVRSGRCDITSSISFSPI